MSVCYTVPSENGKLPFPGISELNARLRRIVAAFQKSHKKELMKQEQNEKVSILSIKVKKNCRLSASFNSSSNMSKTAKMNVISFRQHLVIVSVLMKYYHLWLKKFMN